MVKIVIKYVLETFKSRKAPLMSIMSNSTPPTREYAMPSCPYCLEEIKIGARKCPHCQTALESNSEAQDTAVYIMDKGLIRFAKFVGAVLAVFVLVGIYLFGFDIKEAGEKTSEAKIEVQKALLEIERQKEALNNKIGEIEERVSHIEALEREIAIHRDDTQKSAAQVKQLVLELRRHREEAGQIIVELRTLGATEATVALTKRTERGIEADRGKLWSRGSTLKFHFLDGEKREKTIVRAAIDRWAEHVNLTFSETSSPEAEIRISFKKAGSWSFIGTDALGISPGKPTLNYGFIAQLRDRKVAMQTALHELGHVLGLVHEYQNPSAGEIFDREATLAFYKGAPNHWTEELIMANVLGKSKEYPGSRAYDPESIMNYAFPPELFVPGKQTRPGNDLSESDKRYVASLYPPE